MSIGTKLGLMLICVSVAGCTTSPKYSGQPMNLDEALIAVADAIRKADEHSKGAKATGLVPAEVTVSFDIVNSARDAMGLNVQVVPAGNVFGGPSWAGQVTSTKGSTITITYQNVLFAGTNTVFGSRDGNAIKKLIEELRGSASTLENQSPPKPKSGDE